VVKRLELGPRGRGFESWRCFLLGSWHEPTDWSPTNPGQLENPDCERRHAPGFGKRKTVLTNAALRRVAPRQRAGTERAESKGAGSDRPDDEGSSSVRAQSTGPESNTRDGQNFLGQGRTVGTHHAALRAPGPRCIGPSQGSESGGADCGEPEEGGADSGGPDNERPAREGPESGGAERGKHRTREEGNATTRSPGCRGRHRRSPKHRKASARAPNKPPRAKKRNPKVTLVCPILGVFGPNHRRADRSFAPRASLRTRRRPVVGTSALYLADDSLDSARPRTVRL